MTIVLAKEIVANENTVALIVGKRVGHLSKERGIDVTKLDEVTSEEGNRDIKVVEKRRKAMEDARKRAKEVVLDSHREWMNSVSGDSSTGGMW